MARHPVTAALTGEAQARTRLRALTQQRNEAACALAPTHTVREIVEATGECEQTVRTRLSRCGVQAVEAASGFASPFRASYGEIVAMAAAHSVPDIARKLGVPGHVVYRVLDQAKVRPQRPDFGAMEKTQRRIDLDEAVRRLAATHCPRQIAEALGQPLDGVRVRLCRMGVTAARDPGRRGVAHIHGERARLMAAEHTTREIADALGLSVKQAWSLLKRLGVKAQPVSRAASEPRAPRIPAPPPVVVPAPPPVPRPRTGASVDTRTHSFLNPSIRCCGCGQPFARHWRSTVKCEPCVRGRRAA